MRVFMYMTKQGALLATLHIAKTVSLNLTKH